MPATTTEDDAGFVEALDVLAGMGEHETYTRQRLIDLVIAAVLHRLGETHIEISQEDIDRMARDYLIQSDPAPDGKSVSVRLYPKPDPAQAALTLEVTSEENS